MRKTRAWRQSEIWACADPKHCQQGPEFGLPPGWPSPRVQETRPRGLVLRRVTPGRGQGCEGQAAPSWQEVSALCSLPDPAPPTPSPQNRQLEVEARGRNHPRGSGPPPKNWGLGRIRQAKWLEEPWLPSQRERGSSEEAEGTGAFSLQDPAPKGRGHPRGSERKGPFSTHRIRSWMWA